MTDYEKLYDELVKGTLDAATFRHVDHIGVAHQALSRAGVFDAVATVANGIAAAAQRAGADGKFNATITFAYMSLIAERMAGMPDKSTRDFIDANPDLTNGRALQKIYSTQRMTSETARAIALLPDQAL